MKGIRKPDSLPDDDLRHSSKQIFRVLLGGLAKKVFRLAKFNQFSRSHHGNPARSTRSFLLNFGSRIASGSATISPTRIRGFSEANGS